MISDLFIEFVKLSIGKQDVLSKVPSVFEWTQLYALAEKHAIAGVCFNGIKHLIDSYPDEVCFLPQDLKMQWLGKVITIQRRNQQLNHRCYELQKQLKSDGFTTSILKGQGNATLYPSGISLLRQPGDIDVWVDCGFDKALQYCRKRYGEVEFDYINAHLPKIAGIDVELHWRVQAMSNLFKNYRLQKWMDNTEVKKMLTSNSVRLENGLEIVIPDFAFNTFYQMLHLYHHMFESGLGLRQLMDYYYLLIRGDLDQTKKTWVVKLINEFGMSRFTSAVMWILQEVFGLEDKYLLLESDAKEGSYILNEVMAGGNFGHHDNRIRRVGNGKFQFVFANLQHNWHLAKRYPSEFMWGPLWLIWHWVWKRTNGFIK